MRRAGLPLLSLALLAGCATGGAPTRLAADREAMCRHCNCLMPAGVAPEAICPVCSCGRQAHRCVRGR